MTASKRETRPSAPNLDRPSELCVVHGESRGEVIANTERIRAFLERSTGVVLADVAFSLARTGGQDGPCLALVAATVEELNRKLEQAGEKLKDPKCCRISSRSGMFYFDEPLGLAGKVGFLFPGEGSQYVNMLRELCFHFPEARAAFDLVDRACVAVDGFLPSRCVFPGGRAETIDESTLWGMSGAVEAVIAADTAFMHIFEALDLRPDAVVGHSSGEFLAMEQAGVVRFTDESERIQSIRDGYVLIQNLAARSGIPPAALLAVGGAERRVVDELTETHGSEVRVAMENCPHQYVLCMPPRLVEGVSSRLSESGAIVQVLPFDRPYHTPDFAPALDGIRKHFHRRAIQSSAIPIYSCATADTFPAEPAAIEELCVGQWASAVRFRETVERMYADGVRIFVEVGPRGNLTSFADDILRGRPYVAVAPDRPHQSGITQLNKALAMLSAHRVRMNLSYLFTRRACRQIDFAKPLKEKGAGGRRRTFSSSTPLMSLGTSVSRSSVSVASAGPLASPTKAPVVDTQEPRAPARPLPSGPMTGPMPADIPDAVVLSYLSTMQEFLVTQQEVMRAYMSVTAGEEPQLSQPLPVTVETSPATGPAGHLEAGPMLGSVLHLDPGKSLAVLKTYDVNVEIFLKDHAIGTRTVSLSDDDLTGFPVIPLTLSLEAVAEAAALLVPGKEVVALKDVLATRWISFEEDTRTVLIEASLRAASGPVEVATAIRDADPAGNPIALRPPLLEAVVVLDDHYTESRQAVGLRLRDERVVSWRDADIYPRRLFHGPSLQCVTEIDRWGSNGLTGKARVLPREGLFLRHPNPNLAFDAVLLDGVGSALGLWGASELTNGTVYFPFRIGSIQFHSPPQAPGTEVSFEVQLTGEPQETCVANINTYDSAGKPYISIANWEDRVFPISRAIHSFVQTPLERNFALPLELPGIPADVRTRISPEIPLGVFRSGFRIWEKVLAFVTLDAEERLIWKSMSDDETRRIPWLIGRCAAKDAVRCYLKDHHSLSVGSADIRIVAQDATGRMAPSGTWERSLPAPLELDLSVSGLMAVATVCSSRTGRIGIDVLAPGELDDELLCDALTDEEQVLLRSAGGDLSAWLRRAWCAREALQKAAGPGLVDAARSLHIERLDQKTGSMVLSGAANSGEMPVTTGVAVGAVSTVATAGLAVAVAIQSQ